MMKNRALRVARIQRFCLHDGPGIRTLVFLQGCELRCWWCQNAGMQPAGRGGTVLDADKLAAEVLRDCRYWRSSGGGVTLSGGDPLSQPDGAAALLDALGRHGVHRCVETSCAVPWDAIQAVDPFVDLWLLDLKSVDARAWREGTGGDPQRALENFRRLLERRAASTWIRMALIRGFNDDTESVRAMAEFLGAAPSAARVQILPGHALGGMPPRDPTVAPSTCEAALRILGGIHDTVEICW